MPTERTLTERAEQFHADVARFRADVVRCQQVADAAEAAGQAGPNARFEVENTAALLQAEIVALQALSADMFRESPHEAARLASIGEVFRLLLLETTELRGRVYGVAKAAPAEH
jgi:hypothetical protein